MAGDLSIVEKKTRRAFIWTSALKAPLYALQALLLFILYKELHATPFQLSLFLAMKPAVSLFSVYWSALIHKRPDRLRSNVMLAGLIGYGPFFLLPLFKDAWFLIFAYGTFWTMHRGVMPAWAEILKQNLTPEARQRTFSHGSVISYLSMAILPICFGGLMDVDNSMWQLVFPFVVLLALTSMIFEWQIPIQSANKDEPPSWVSPKEALLRPWKNTIELFQTRPDFLRYQLGFMLGGGGLMLMQPALAPFFCDELKLSYTELAIALAICKGIGYALTSRIWASWMDHLSIYSFSAVVTVLAGLFPLALMMGTTQIAWIYMAYLLYGIMQAGSEMSWNLSGPIFSQDEDSSAYSSVNLVTVGLRGLLAPFLGAYLCGVFTAYWVLLFGGILCAAASLQLSLANRRYTQAPKPLSK